MSRRYGIAVLAAVGAVTFCTPLPALAGPGDGASVDTIATVLDEDGRPAFIEVEAATVAQERRTAAALAGVVEVSAEVPTTALATTNDTYRYQQWGNTKVGSDAYTSVSTGNQLVAVLDSGIKASHEDFATGQIRCDIGADFTGETLSTNGCVDPHGHGTHVAGTVGAVANNGKGIAGIAPGVPILPVRVLGAGGGGTSTTVSKGIVYAVDRGATVITMSLGGGYAATLDTAVKYATDHNVVVIAAAGNNRASGNAAQWPAASPGAESVAATDSSNVTATFSNSSGTADIAAPGVNTASTLTDGSYGFKSGTSMAAPHVAAAAALYRATHPGSTEAGTRAALESAATDIEGPGRDAASGAGLLNLAALLSTTPGGPVTPPTTPPVTPAPVTPAPSVPVKLVVTPTATAISLTWAASAKTATTPAATSYVVRRNGVTLATSRTAAYVDKAITAGTNYTYTAAAVAGSATSAPSVAVPAYLAPAAPTKPTVTTSATTITLRWTAPVKLPTTGPPSTYVIYRDGQRFATTTAASFTDQAGTNHTYAVSAANPAGESARTASLVAYLVPAAPTTLAALPVAAAIKLSWQASAAKPAVSGNPVSYTVYRDGAKLATVTTLTYTDTALPTGTNPTYTVSAANPAGQSAPSIPATAYKAPARPTGVTIMATAGTIKLAWRAPAANATASAATAYTVHRDGVRLATTAGLSYVDSSAKANVVYKYTVVATNVAGAGPASAVVQRSWTAAR
jgi:subtilisin family serine protease